MSPQTATLHTRSTRLDIMPRNHKRKPGSRRYRDYTPDSLENAIHEVTVLKRRISIVATEYNIPERTLRNKIKGVFTKNPGGQKVFSEIEENLMVENLLKCAEFGMPLETSEIQIFVKGYLNNSGRIVEKFKNNTPGVEWVYSFVKKHPKLTLRTCQNIKRARAEVSQKTIQLYFKNLQKVIEGIPPENILNYDETNLADDPGVKKCVFRRGVKYPERIINHSKGNISLMFSGSASGELLPPYVIYKAEHIWNTWAEGGPPGTRYNRSDSGWMTQSNFEEWFENIVVIWARRKPGKKVVIGDNLSSHISMNVLSLCKKYNIDFVLLPPHSTDKCQPLDVSFFRPIKRAWRKIMEKEKTSNPSSNSLNKGEFPRLLKELIDQTELNNKDNLIAGFKACGIYPYDPSVVLKKFPGQCENTSDTEEESCSPNKKFQISESLLEFLQQFKYDPENKQKSASKPKKKK